MAVYERGYRAYEGGFGSHRPGLAIFAHAYRITFRSRSFKILGMITILAYAIAMLNLFMALNIQETIERAMQQGREFDSAKHTLKFLNPILLAFYWTITFAAAVVAMLGGAGLIADDIRSKSLALHLVRPIRPMTYVLGKALVLPALMVWILLLPGVSMYLFAGLWQPSDSGAWLAENSDVLWRVIRLWLVATCGFTGVMLFLSSRTGRRGSVIGIAAGVFFGGFMLAGLGMGLEGATRDLLKHSSIILNSMVELQDVVLEEGSGRRVAKVRERMPDANAALLLSFALLAIGMVAAWRRARTAEISE